MKSKITQALVERSPTPDKGKSTLYADTEMRGFYLIVTPTKRSFYVQSLVNGKQVRTKLGDHPALDAKQARDLARTVLVGMRGGTKELVDTRYQQCFNQYRVFARLFQAFGSNWPIKALTARMIRIHGASEEEAEGAAKEIWSRALAIYETHKAALKLAA